MAPKRRDTMPSICKTMPSEHALKAAFCLRNQGSETRWPRTATFSRHKQSFYVEGMWPGAISKSSQLTVASSVDEELTNDPPSSPFLFGHSKAVDMLSSSRGLEAARSNAAKLVLMTVLLSRLLRTHGTRPSLERPEKVETGSDAGASEAVNAAISNAEQSASIQTETAEHPTMSSVGKENKPLALGSSGPVPQLTTAATARTSPATQQEEQSEQSEVVLSEKERMEMEQKLLLFKSMVGKPLEEVEEENDPTPPHSASPAVAEIPSDVDTTPSLSQATSNTSGSSTEVSYAIDDQVAEAPPILLPEAIEKAPSEPATEPETRTTGQETAHVPMKSWRTREEGESLEDHAYRILLELGMIEEHPDPDDPNYDHSSDDDFA